MKTVKLSKTLVAAYDSASVDISYALSELMGAVSYDNATQMHCIPMEAVDTVPYDIDDSAFEEIADKFDNLDDISSMAEILLWGNFLMGARL